VEKIVVIGTGRMGGAFATAFAKRPSHAVSIRGSHAGSSSAAALSRQLGVRVADDKELLAADVAFVATPPATLDDVTAALKGLRGHHRFGNGSRRRRLRAEARRRYKRG
jgi:prephenate dehydrogenase